MNDNKFFDEDAIEKVREYEKSDRAKAEAKKKFEQMHKKEIMAEAAKNSIDPSELLEIYVGSGYKGIAGKNFNFWAFLLGPVYMLYRKMYVYGFLLMVFTSSVSIFITTAMNNSRTADTKIVLFASIAFYLIVGIIVGLTFNGMYLNFCMGKINNIRDRYRRDKEKIIDACKFYGGTSIIWTFILLCALTGVAVAVAKAITSVAN